MKTERKRRSHRPFISLGCFLIFFALTMILIGGVWAVPMLASRSLGPVSDHLNGIQRIQYSALMIWYDGLVTRPVDSTAGEVPFTIAEGDSAASVAARLENDGIIRSAEAFTAY